MTAMKTILGTVAMVGVCTVSGGTKSVGYVGASGAKGASFHVVEVDNETGALSVVGEQPLANSTYIAVNKARTRLYTSCSDSSFGGKGADGGVAVYALGAGGKALTRLDAVGTTRGSPCHLSLSPDERRLVFAEYGTGTAGWVSLNADGTFARETRGVVVSSDPVGPNQPRQDRPHCHCARVTPDGRYICVVDLGTDRVKVFAQDGSFVRDLVTSPAGGGPRHLIFHPNGKLAFLLFELRNLVTSYRYADGTFTPIQQVSLLPEDFKDFSKAAAVKLSSDGTELYCSNRGHDSIAVLSVDPATGHLSRRGILSVGGKFPWDFEFMPGGKILVVGLEEEGIVRSYRYDAAACSLTPIAEVTGMGAIFCTAFFPAN